MRILVLRKEWWYDPLRGRMYLNVFDAVLVSINFLELLIIPAIVGDGSQLSANQIRLIKLSRVARTLRVIKSLSLFRQLRHLVGTCIASVGAMFWSIVLLVLCQLTFALMACQALQPFIMTLGYSTKKLRPSKPGGLFKDMTSNPRFEGSTFSEATVVLEGCVNCLAAGTLPGSQAEHPPTELSLCGVLGWIRHVTPNAFFLQFSNLRAHEIVASTPAWEHGGMSQKASRNIPLLESCPWSNLLYENTRSNGKSRAVKRINCAFLCCVLSCKWFALLACEMFVGMLLACFACLAHVCFCASDYLKARYPAHVRPRPSQATECHHESEKMLGLYRENGK